MHVLRTFLSMSSLLSTSTSSTSYSFGHFLPLRNASTQKSCGVGWPSMKTGAGMTESEANAHVSQSRRLCLSHAMPLRTSIPPAEPLPLAAFRVRCNRRTAEGSAAVRRGVHSGQRRGRRVADVHRQRKSAKQTKCTSNRESQRETGQGEGARQDSTPYRQTREREGGRAEAVPV
eukprot:COSAG04_NODE_435_length_14466_cov_135.545486_11_plen_175_part_00